jgi:phosphoglycerol transferase MdoB-like AlkP superfamily enzyme
MSVAAVLLPLTEVVGWAVDKTPKDEDVKAGWTAFVIFLLLIAAVVVLAFSFTKQLRKAQAAKDAGLYGDEPAAPETADEPDHHGAS